MQAASVWKAQAIRNNPGGLVPPSKLLLLHNAVLATCDARDGIKDGLLEDPRSCEFDPKILECKEEDHPDCLTAAQIVVVRAFYGPTVNPRTGEQLFPGMVLGSELGWSSDVGRMYPDPPDITKTLATAYLRYAVFQDPKWDYMKFDFDSGMALADHIDDGLTRATDPNLSDFFRRGGKLLQYHGWSDPSISPLNSINYYNSVLEFMGGPAKVQNSYRLFMAPGMNHCGGGDGPNTFDSIRTIEEWVETGKAPDQIVASRIGDGKTERTRPLCPYPQVATYRGTGSTDDAPNFSCSLSK